MVGLTAAMMVAEIIGGTLFGSMAVVADGWHMATHAGALAIAALAYGFARHHARDPRFTFGTGKVGELAAFTSAVILAMIAAAIGYEALTRLFEPIAIDFTQATWLAVLGLGVNLASAWLLFDDDHHHGRHDHGHAHDHDEHVDHDHGQHPAQDSNIRAAYVHVLADAMTSVLAIIGLLAGRFLRLGLDGPADGAGRRLRDLKLVGWTGAHGGYGAARHGAGPASGRCHPQAARDRRRPGLRLHLWRLGPGHAGLIASVVTDRPQVPSFYKARLDGIAGLSHVTVEVHTCEDHKQAA